jgi:outer membrane protein
LRLKSIYGASASVLIGALGASAATTSQASGETLAEALALAYQSNPVLQQARAQQRALDETTVQARAGFRPTLGVSGADDYEQVFQTPSYSVNSGGATLNVTQPLYTSGKTTAAVRSADAGIAAGRENLRATEAQVLLSVITAYEDVLRDQTILGVREDDVNALGRALDEVNAKRQVGQITRTDVLQIQAQLSTAKAAVAAAQAQLQNSRAEYAAAVGQNPGTLEPPPVLPQLPKDVDAAFDVAEAENPVLKAAKLTEDASRERIAEAKAAFGPTVAVGAQYGYSGSTTPAQTVDYNRAFTAQVTVTQPLFAGGVNSSLVRQAIEQNEADRLGVERARRQVVEGVAQTWNQAISVARSISAYQEGYDSAKLELEGMQEEYKVALRSTLEVLSADEALRAAEVNLATAGHDQYVAEATLLGNIGRLEAAYIVTGAPLYDAKKNFKKVKNKGSLPYEGLIAGLDSISIAHPGAPKPIPTPARASGPVAIPEGAAPSPDAPLATTSPTAPSKATVEPKPQAEGASPGGASKAEPPRAMALPRAAGAPAPAAATAQVLPQAVAGEVLRSHQAEPEAVRDGAPALIQTASLQSPPPSASGPAAAAQALPPAPRPEVTPEANEVASKAPASGQIRSVAAVQIGAYQSLPLAEEGWSQVESLMRGDILGKSKAISTVHRDGATLYRTVIAGFTSFGDAERFCTDLKSKGGACFVKGG